MSFTAEKPVGTLDENFSNNVRERLCRYIDDLIALEASSITGLNTFIHEATDPSDALMFQEHLTQTEAQKRRLEERLAELGGKNNQLKDFMNKVGVAATELLHLGKDPEDKAARNMMEAYAVESAEIAAYEALHAAALEAKDQTTADLAKSIQEEEEAAAKKVFARIAPLSSESIRIGPAAGRN